MNKIQILQQLHDTANQLEKKGLYAEANVLTNVMTKVAQQPGQSNLNALYNNFQQTTQQPNQAPQQPQQQPGQQAGREITKQEHDRLMQLYNEFGHYRDKFSSLSKDAHDKIYAGILLQETNNVPNASLMLQQILDYLINLNNQINALLNIDGIDATDQKYMNSAKGLIDTFKEGIDTMTKLHQSLKSKGKRIPQQPQ